MEIPTVIRILSAFIVLLSSCTGQVIENDLDKTIFKNYNPRYRAAKTKSEKTVVYLSLYIRDMNEVNENQQTIAVHGNYLMVWRDYRLQWAVNQSRRDWFQTVGYKVWKPDLTVVNRVYKRTTYTKMPANFVSVFRDGSVRYYTYFTERMTCKFDFTAFPNDVQKCKMLISSWVYPYAELDWQWNQRKTATVSMEWMGSELNRTQSSGWTLKDVSLSKFYAVSAGKTRFYQDPPPLEVNPRYLWPMMAAEFTFARHRPYFAMLEVTPLVLCALLVTVSFCIDSDVVAVGMLSSSLMTMGICSWMLLPQLPIGGGGERPKIVDAYALSFAMASLMLMLRILMQRFAHSDRNVLYGLGAKLVSKPWMMRAKPTLLNIGSFGTDFDDIQQLTERSKDEEETRSTDDDDRNNRKQDATLTKETKAKIVTVCKIFLAFVCACIYIFGYSFTLF